jgi:enoyl-CoA hydratase
VSIDVEIRGSIALVTINRPERRNAMNEEAWRDLGQTFRSLDVDDAIRAVVLTGSGGAFCAGDDILAFASVRNNPSARTRYWNHIMECYAAVSGISVPVVAAVSGPCVGGGCTLALRADFRFADSTARFGVPPAKLGLVYPADSTQLLVSTTGSAMAKRMLYTGDLINAQEARECGLVSRISDDVVEDAIAFAAPMTVNAPISIRAAKLATDAAIAGRLSEVAHSVAELSAMADQSKDYQEGARAFAEKRKPVFVGR